MSEPAKQRIMRRITVVLVAQLSISAALTRREVPSRTLCKDDETWLGRYCNRGSGHAGVWYEKCWMPSSAARPPSQSERDMPSPSTGDFYGDFYKRPTPSSAPAGPAVDLPDGRSEGFDVTPTASWIGQVSQELILASEYRLDHPVVTTLSAYISDLHGGGRESRYDHACPAGFVCMQLLDPLYRPHVLCQHVTPDDTAIYLEPRPEPAATPEPLPGPGDENQPPKAQAHTKGPRQPMLRHEYHRVQLHATFYPSLPPGAPVMRWRGSFVAENDMEDVFVSAVVFDPATMELLYPDAAPATAAGLVPAAANNGSSNSDWPLLPQKNDPFALITVRKGQRIEIDVAVTSVLSRLRGWTAAQDAAFWKGEYEIRALVLVPIVVFYIYRYVYQVFSWHEIAETWRNTFALGRGDHRPHIL